MLISFDNRNMLDLWLVENPDAFKLGLFSYEFEFAQPFLALRRMPI